MQIQYQYPRVNYYLLIEKTLNIKLCFWHRQLLLSLIQRKRASTAVLINFIWNKLSN